MLEERCWIRFQLFAKGLYVRELAVEDHCPCRVPRVALCPVLMVEAAFVCCPTADSNRLGPGEE